MKKYIRSTRDKDGKNKEFSYAAKKFWNRSWCYGHMLLPKTPLSLDEIVEEHAKYDNIFPGGLETLHKDLIEVDLLGLVHFGLASEVEDD